MEFVAYVAIPVTLPDFPVDNIAISCIFSILML